MAGRTKAGSRLLAYSVTIATPTNENALARQLEISLGTLRRYSPTLDVVLFCHGRLPPRLAALSVEHDVMVHPSPDYARRLRALCPNGWPALLRYPLLHKFLNFDALVGSDVSQLLCCDCDTVFFGPAEPLFERHGDDADLVAREEVHSSRSAYGADASFIDESLLARLARHEGATPVPPFNLGFVLINRPRWSDWSALQPLFVDYAWRFVCGMALDPLDEGAPYAEFAGIEQARERMDANDVARALPFPSSNRWLLDEVALWMTLGHVPGLVTADFPVTAVAQDGEFERVCDARSSCTACHYFSSNIDRVEAWLDPGARSALPRH